VVVPAIGVRELLDLRRGRNRLEARNICLGRAIAGIGQLYLAEVK
jgi:hypothetical protein